MNPEESLTEQKSPSLTKKQWRSFLDDDSQIGGGHLENGKATLFNHFLSHCHCPDSGPHHFT